MCPIILTTGVVEWVCNSVNGIEINNLLHRKKPVSFPKVPGDQIYAFIQVTKHVQKDQSGFLKAHGYFHIFLAPVQIFEVTSGQISEVIQQPKIYTQVLLGPT